MLKKLNKKFFSTFLFIVILFILFLFTLIASYSNAVISDISEHILRLHVIANSNSQEDQRIKYEVRDVLLGFMQKNSDIKTKDDAIEFISENTNILTELANQVLIRNGCDYTASISITYCDFPTKSYANTSFPAGTYQALRVELGDASGENWWCVIFPPLCFVNISDGVLSEESQAYIQDTLTEEEYRLISSDEADIQLKFRFVEWFQSLKNVES